MKNLKITSEAVAKAYRNASADGKSLLREMFGSQVSLSDDVRDTVRSFNDACTLLGISTNLPEVSSLPELHRKAIRANYKLIIIAEALNEGWRPDWNNTNEFKYFPWFTVSTAGLGYSSTSTTTTHANANIGSRLCFKNRELAIYFGQQFIDLWEDVLLIEK
ncbi:MAG: hypothetical protein VB022_10885 [Rikenellaceae bacterium]|nr:hypothetical protein [Rikenellaceae bacterium]